METKVRVNLNTAKEEEIAQVRGIGPVLAERIVAARPFDTFDDVRRVPGIGASTLDLLASYVTVEETPSGEPDEDKLGFVDIPSAEEEQRAAEVPADLIPLPSLPVIPPWDEDEAESATPTAKEKAPEKAAAAVPPPLPEMPPALPEPPAEATGKAKSPTPSAPGAKPKPEAPQARPPAAKEPPSKPVTRAQLGWVSFGVFVATLLITLALSLGILAGINGGLTYASPSDVARVAREATALQGEVETLEQSLNRVQSRLDSLEAVSERVQALETATDDVQREIEALTTQAESLATRIQDLEQDTTTLNTQMERVQAQSERVQEVMNGLRDLLTSLFPEE